MWKFTEVSKRFKKISLFFFFYKQRNITKYNANQIMRYVSKSAQKEDQSIGPTDINFIVTLSEQFLPYVPYFQNSQELLFEIIDALLDQSRILLEESQHIYTTSERFVYVYLSIWIRRPE